MTKAKNIEDPDLQLISQIAEKYKVDKVFMLKIPVNDEGTKHAIGFIKKPSRATMGAAMSMMAKNPLKANEIILRSSWLEGDQSILDDDDQFLAASALLEQIIQIRAGEVKKN